MIRKVLLALMTGICLMLAAQPAALADRPSKEALAAEALAANPGWTLWRQSGYSSGKWQDEMANHAEVWLMRVDADALRVRYLTVVTNPLSEGDHIPWEVIDYAPIPLTAEASARLASMNHGEIFTYGTYAVLSETALPGCATELISEDEQLTTLVAMKNETLVGIATDDRGYSRLFVGTWDGGTYHTVTTPKQGQPIYLNEIHSTWDYLEAYSPATMFSISRNDDGSWRLSRISWYDEAGDCDYDYFLNDDWVINQRIDEYGEWQNNDGYLYGRYIPSRLITELDLSPFPCRDIQALLDTGGFACSRADGTVMYDAPNGTPIATCYARLAGTVTEEQGDWVCLQLGSTERGMTSWFHRGDLAFGDEVNEIVCGFPAYEDWPNNETLFPQLNTNELLLLGLNNRHWLVGQTSEGNWLVMANQDAMVVAPVEAYTGIGPTEHYWDIA